MTIPCEPVSVQNPMIQHIKKASEFFLLAAVWILPFSKAGFEIFFALTFFCWLSAKAMTRGSLCADRTLFVLLGLFLMCASVSAFHSGYPDASFRGMIKLLKYALLMLVVIDLFSNPGSLKRLFVIGLSSFGLVLLDSLMQKIGGRELILGHPVQYANNQVRLTGPYSSYGLLAAHLIAFLPILITWVMPTQKTSVFIRAARGVLILITLYVLYETKSRGGWLAVFAALALYGSLARNKWLLITLAAAMLILPFALPKTILFHLDSFKREQSLVERNLLWNRALSVIKARPWFGCGINTYTKNYPKYAQGEKWSLMKMEAEKNEYARFGEKESWRIPGHPNQIPDYYVHNGYLQLAAETGLITLGLFFAVLGVSLFSAVQALKKTVADKKLFVIGSLSGLVALLLQAAVDTTFHNLQSAVFIWFFLGLLIAMKQAGGINDRSWK